MMKHLLTGCIKLQEKIPSWKIFNMLLETVDIGDKIGHLFVVNIEFKAAKVNAKTLTYNEIYTPIFKKEKK